MKFKLHSISLFVLLPFFLCTNSCKEKFECSPGNTVLIPQVMKDFFFFKEGTWWVYKNVKNNTYDSIWVWKHNFDIYRGEGKKEGFGHLDKCYEQIIMAIANPGSFNFMRWSIANLVVDERERFLFTISWRDTSTNVNKSFDLFFTNGQLETIPPLHPIVISTIDSVMIQNKKYSNLIEVDAYNYYYDNIKYRLFAKNTGLIKYIDRDSNQWELIKYNIYQ